MGLSGIIVGKLRVYILVNAIPRSMAFERVG